jgi:hypothetical protein
MGTAARNTWKAQLKVMAPAHDVLDALTYPEACSRWSPIEFELDELDGARLTAGSRARVAGRLAGARMGFDVEVFEAHAERLALRASGAVVLDVDYRLSPVGEGSTEVSASVTVEGGRGLLGRTLERATRALLAAGALEGAVARIARQVEAPPEASALAA